MADETKNFGRKEQLAISLRCFDGQRICDRLIGCFHMKELSVKALTEYIYVEVQKLSIDWITCVTQCYDGANVVQAQLNEKVSGSDLFYVHCYVYRLNVVLIDTLKAIPCIFDALTLIQSLFNFINGSDTRNELFMRAQDELKQTRFELD